MTNRDVAATLFISQLNQGESTDSHSTADR
jgi:hypothetical protein